MVQPAFVSVVCVVNNSAEHLAGLLSRLSDCVRHIADDYEVIIVDNGSTDGTVKLLRDLTSDDGLPNLQVFALTSPVSYDVAAWVGLESALGDVTIVMDLLRDRPDVLGEMVRRVTAGAEVVLAVNTSPSGMPRRYRLLRSGFERVLGRLTGVRLSQDAVHFRAMTREVVRFLLSHQQQESAYRLLPSSGGFVRETVTYAGEVPVVERPPSWVGSLDRGVRLLVSTSRVPLRLVTALCVFGAFVNLVYAAYVVVVTLVQRDVQPGWTTLSLQLSGMFFLFSLVLMMLSEYILHTADLARGGPRHHVAREMTSTRILSRERLNVQYVVSDTDR